MRTESGAVLYCVRGVFHDWCCAAKYIKTYHPKDEAELLSYLCEVEAKFSGRRRLNIVESSSKFQMKQFAGEDGITIEQWNRINDRRTAEGTMYADQHG